jgi:hypothetical protein
MPVIKCSNSRHRIGGKCSNSRHRIGGGQAGIEWAQNKLKELKGE